MDNLPNLDADVEFLAAVGVLGRSGSNVVRFDDRSSVNILT